MLEMPALIRGGDQPIRFYSEDSEDQQLSTESDLAELAAHPLNSINPYPEDLPDLLDNVISNSQKLHTKLDECQKMAQNIVPRIHSLRRKLEAFRAQFASQQSERKKTNPATSHRGAILVKAQDMLLTRMILQTTFLHHVLTKRLKPQLTDAIVAHKDILDAFLGEHHNHPGIEVANSTALECTEDCSWYFMHGPYEWSKKPYSCRWQQEMNSTDWDWGKVREHIVELGRKNEQETFESFERFRAQVRNHISSWFWDPKLESWSLHANVKEGFDAYGQRKEKIVLFVKYQKSRGNKSREHDVSVQLAEVQGVHGGRDGGNSVSQDCNAAVNSEGVHVLHPQLAFDGHACAPDWEDGGEIKRQGSWLESWGFQAWMQESCRRQHILNSGDRSTSLDPVDK